VTSHEVFLIILLSDVRVLIPLKLLQFVPTLRVVLGGKCTITSTDLQLLMFADYIRFKAPFLGVWIAPSQSYKSFKQGQRSFPSTAPYRIWDPINLLFNGNNLGGGGQAVKLILIECQV